MAWSASITALRCRNRGWRRRLGLKVIAEGMETQEQHDLLAQMGCDEVQGYLHRRPMSADEVPIWLGVHDASA